MSVKHGTNRFIPRANEAAGAGGDGLWTLYLGGVIAPTNVLDTVAIGGSTMFAGEKLRVVGDVRIEGKLTVTGAIDPTSVSLSDPAAGTALYFDSANGITAPVAPAGHGRIRYNNTTHTWQVSVNTLPYADLATTNSFQQGGNAFGATGVLGTNDAFGMSYITSGIERMSVSTAGVIRFGLAGSSLPRTEYTTTDATLFAAIQMDEAPFNGTIDHIMRLGSFNLNQGGNFIDPTRMGFEQPLEYEYDVGGPTGGVVTGASNTNPIVITTTTNHGLTNNDTADIAGSTGNTAANVANWPINVLTSKTFQLVGRAGNGAYTGGAAVTYHRKTLEWYVTFQQPGSNAEFRPLGATFNNDGLYGCFAGLLGQITFSSTDATLRAQLQDKPSGTTAFMIWGTPAANGVSHSFGLNNIQVLFQTGSGGGQVALMGLNNAGGGVDGNDQLTLAPSGNPVLFGGGVISLAEQNPRTIKVADTSTLNFNGGGLTVQAGKANGNGVGGNLSLLAGGSPAGTKGNIFIGDADTLAITMTASALSGLTTSGGAITFDGFAGMNLKKNTALYLDLGVTTASTVTLAGGISLVGGAGTGAVNFGVLTGDFTFPTGNVSWTNAGGKTFTAIGPLEVNSGTGFKVRNGTDGFMWTQIGANDWAIDGNSAATYTLELGRSRTVNVVITGSLTQGAGTGNVSLPCQSNGTWLGGNTSGTASMTLDAGSGAIQIGHSASARTWNVGDGNAIQTVNFYNHATPVNVFNFLGANSKFGAFGTAAVVKQTITGSLSTIVDPNAKAVITSIIAAFAAAAGYGLVADGTT